MKNKILIAVAAAALVFSTDIANADTHSRDLKTIIGIINASNPSVQSSTVFDDEAGVAELPARTVERLHEIARDQAGIWADTILEGDYFADGATRLDRVIAYVRGEQVVAYRITYSERAWDTSACEFDAEELETLVTCTPGRIVESSFVSPDLTSFTRDYDDLANFNE